MAYMPADKRKDEVSSDNAQDKARGGIETGFKKGMSPELHQNFFPSTFMRCSCL